eukprot:gene20560-28211_t
MGEGYDIILLTLHPIETLKTRLDTGGIPAAAVFF